MVYAVVQTSVQTVSPSDARFARLLICYRSDRCTYGFGYGLGNGTGYGYGDGSGDGSGYYGEDEGEGDGDGEGGYGYGEGDGGEGDGITCSDDIELFTSQGWLSPLQLMRLL